MKRRSSRFARFTPQTLATILLLLVLALPAFAAPFATADDTAANSAYNDGWQTGDNGGTGMNSWSLSTYGSSGTAGHFIGSTNCAIVTSNNCWSMYANGQMTAEAVRSFTSALGVNTEVFTIFLDNGSIDTGGSVGIELKNTSDQTLIAFYFVGGGSNYLIADGSSSARDSTVGFTNSGLRVQVFLPTSTTYLMAITTLSPSSVKFVAGSLQSQSGGASISKLRLYNFKAGNGSSNDAFFNRISIANGTLAVTLADFFAQQVGDHVRVTWETASELGNVGFNLYRGTSPAGPDRRLNDLLIPSQSLGNPGGFTYTWDDYADLVPGTTYYYWVEDVDVNNAATRHGPVSVDFVVPTAVTLAGVQASPAAALPALPWLAVVAGAGAALALGRRKNRG